MAQLLDFTQDNRRKNTALIVAGDLNAGPLEVIPGFAKLGMITPQTNSTSVTKDQTLDYYSYEEANILGIARATVPDQPATDHRPVVVSWPMRP